MANTKPNKGSFKPGHDPRRMNSERFKDGQTFRQACRDKSLDCLQFMVDAINDPEEQSSLKFKCAAYIIDQGYGKAPSTLQLQGEGSTPVEDMSTAELKARLVQFLRDSTEKPVLGVTIGNECEKVLDTALPIPDNVSHTN